MHLLLTNFHIYLENIILQVTNTNAWKISPKGTFQHRFAEKNKGDAHQINSKWAKHPRGATHVQPMACHVKAVVRRLG
jgi:hypothetical protein